MGLFFCDRCQRAPDENGRCGCDQQDAEEAPAACCDCCPVCIPGPGACCGMPEYNCPGYCGHRGEPAHYPKNAPNPEHPMLSFPERL